MDGKRSARWRETVLAALWIVLLAFAATAPALFGNRSLGPEFVLDSDPLYALGDPTAGPPVFDGTRYYQDIPRDFAAADGIHHGRFDAWNPRVGLGMPLWGDGGGFFFPAKIPFYLLPARRTYDFAVALRLVIAGLGAFLLARRRLALLPALAAGSLFELSGAIMGTLQLGVMAAACMLPWVLLGASAIARRPRPAAAAATGIALAVTASSGHPMLVLVVFVGFAAAVAGHVLAAWRNPRTALAIGALATVAVVLGLAIAAPAVLPVLQAQEAGRLYKETKIYTFQFGWYRAQTRGFLPIALFAPATLNGLRQSLSVGFPYALLTPTLGLLTLVLAIAGLLRWGLDIALLFVLLAGVGLTLAPPILGLIGQLPLVRYVYPMYAWSLVTLPLTQAAGKGVAALTTQRKQWGLLAALVIVLVGASSLVSLKDIYPGTFFAIPVREAFGARVGDWPGRLSLVLPLVALPLVVIGLVLAARAGFGSRSAVVATAIAVLELLLCVAPATWFPDSIVLGSTPSPAVQFLQRHLSAGSYRLLGSPRTVGTPATPSLFGLMDARGMAAIPVERYVRYLEAISPQTGWYVWQVPGNVVRHPLLDLAAVRYIAQPQMPESEPAPLLRHDAAIPLAYRDDHVAIYENEAALPRARIVHRAIAVRNAEEAFHHLVKAAAGQAHAASAGLVDRVFVEPSADGDLPETLPAEVSSDAEYARIVPSDDPDQVDVRANLSRAGWVVLADTYYPGWKATVDGVPKPIHPTDLVFRGVFVPSGAHRISFRYEPPAFRLGLLMAAIGLAISGFLLVRREPTRGEPFGTVGAGFRRA